MSKAHPRARRIRWLASARLQITTGITVTAALILASVLLIANQLLWLSAERTANQRIEKETANFANFVSTGTLPSTGAASPSEVALLRSYLALQYPSPDLLLVATAPDPGTQFTLSKNAVDSDPLFGLPIRVQLQQIGKAESASSGTLMEDIRWGKVVVDGPNGRANLVVAVNASLAREDIRNIIDQLVPATGVGLILTALTAWVLAGRMLVPVRRVREAADTISADDLSRRVPEGGPDEVAALARTLNDMLDRMEGAYRTQREFLDDAGHELRTPLTVVQGYLDLVPDDPLERAETIRIMQDEVSRMTRIVEDLLTLARSDRPDFLRPSATDVGDLVLDVEAKTEVMANRVWDVRPEAEGEALLDRHRITQGLLQFAANAVKFTREGDRIEIGCRILEPGTPTVDLSQVNGTVAETPAGENDSRRLLWWVRDSGPGVPDSEVEAIFHRFHTARGQLRDGRGGTGLGLAIVSTIARAHDGRTFAFNAVGGGAAFCIVVPFRQARNADVRAKPAARRPARGILPRVQGGKL